VRTTAADVLLGSVEEDGCRETKKTDDGGQTAEIQTTIGELSSLYLARSFSPYISPVSLNHIHRDGCHHLVTVSTIPTPRFGTSERQRSAWFPARP